MGGKGRDWVIQHVEGHCEGEDSLSCSQTGAASPSGVTQPTVQVGKPRPGGSSHSSHPDHIVR